MSRAASEETERTQTAATSERAKTAGRALDAGSRRRYFVSEGYHVQYFETEKRKTRHGRFDLDAKRSFRLLPRTLLLSRCKWPRRWVKFRFYLCVFYASPGALVRPPDTFP